MSEIDLQERFPEMRPVKSAPGLWTINGCGTSLYGSRDRDPETGTYVTTLCLTFVFIPLFAISSYRVALAPSQGWYFLGRVPLSGLAWAWNFAVAVCLAGAIGGGTFHVIYNSPDAIAARKFSEAEQKLENGKVVEAAEAFRSLRFGHSSKKSEALAKLETLHEHPKVQAASIDDLKRVLEIELLSHESKVEDPLEQAIYRVGLEKVKEDGLSDPENAANLISMLVPLAIDLETINEVSQPIYEALLTSEPDNVAFRGQLALIYESDSKLDQCRELLETHAEKLGESEGARILGQIWMSDGREDEALPLLEAYCESRLSALRKAEQSYDAAYEIARENVISQLQRGEAPQSFYDQYDSASEEGQIELVETIIATRLSEDVRLEGLRESYVEALSVVPAGMDLGMALLRKAQATKDAEEQRELLESAEETFFAVRSVMGDSDEFRLYLGQVNYWLGKFEEGKALFDALLTDNDRNPEYLTVVASLVRSVGRDAEARELAEEASEATEPGPRKFNIASFRAAMMTSLEDQIVWLERADPNDQRVIAGLFSAKGSLAQRDGKREQAQVLLRKSIDAFAQLEENAATLNNSGLVFIQLYQLVGETSDYVEGLRRLEKAIEFAPTDSTVRSNTAAIITSSIYRDLVNRFLGDVDWNRVVGGPSDRLLALLSHDRSSERVVGEAMSEHPRMSKATDLLQEVLVLAPKGASHYLELLELYRVTEDVDAIEQLRTRTLDAKPEVDYVYVKNLINKNDDHGVLVESLRTMTNAAWDALEVDDLNSPTKECLALHLTDRLAGLATFENVDRIDEAIGLLQRIYDERPSSGTENALHGLHLIRLHQSLISNNRQYAEIAEANGGRVPPSYLIVALINDQPTLRESIIEHPDFVASAEWLKKSILQDGGFVGTWSWAMLRHVEPELVDNHQESDERQRIRLASQDIERRTSRSPFTEALMEYWELQRSGEEAADLAFERLDSLGF
ncbi:MAG: hypothetical protein AAF802_12985, partial [Planctomycetota bacterium]